jgi:hypothetical protein
MNQNEPNVDDPTADGGTPPTGSQATASVQPDITTPSHPATQKQKIAAATAMWLLTCVTLLAWFCALHRIEAQLQTEHSVQWNAPTNAVLKPGPPAFNFDRSNNVLCYKGVIDAPTKQQLISLITTDETNNAAPLTQSYADAVGRLAYEANDVNGQTLFYLLLLGALSSMLGVLLRLMVSFVGVICYKQDLDLVLWWPYYVMRPPVGFLIGLIVVLLVKSELLLKGEAVTSGSLWWAGIALLAGFGASEFTEKLTLLSRALFGGSESDIVQKT